MIFPFESIPVNTIKCPVFVKSPGDIEQIIGVSLDKLSVIYSEETFPLETLDYNKHCAQNSVRERALTSSGRRLAPTEPAGESSNLFEFDLPVS